MSLFRLRSCTTWPLALAALMPTLVQAEEWPVSLALSQTLTRDSNVLRDNNDRYADTISSTGVRVSFDKSYGRQRYVASITGVRSRYDKTSEYNNDGFESSAQVSSEFGRNFFGLAGFSASRQLQKPEDQQGSRFKETVSSRNAKLYGQYGLFGRMSANVTGNFDQAKYDRATFNDKDSRSIRVGLRYSPSDLLFFDAGYRNGRVDNLNQAANVVDRDDLDLTSQWVVTGFSKLNARVSFTDERSQIDSRRDFSGLTGSFDWSLTPPGKMSYVFSASRDTNNAGGQSFGNTGFFTSRNFLTNKLSARASWAATAKINVTSGLNYQRYELERDSNLPGFDSRDKSSLKSIDLGFGYQYSRALALQCRLEHYDRTRSSESPEFDGQEVSCTGTFFID